jgi:hypothetical protein
MLIPCVMSGMNASQSGDPMPEVLLDSDILIDHLRGYEPARQYLKRFEAGEMQDTSRSSQSESWQPDKCGKRKKRKKSIDCWHCSRRLPSILLWAGAGVRFDGNTTPAWRMP